VYQQFAQKIVSKQPWATAELLAGERTQKNLNSSNWVDLSVLPSCSWSNQNWLFQR